MKVIFLRDMQGKGNEGEVKTVSEGYAKNFLLPRGIAIAATPSVMKQVEARLRKGNREKTIDQAKLAGLASQIEGTEIHIHAHIGSEGRLFGSITATDIAEELRRVISHFEPESVNLIDKRNIDIDKPIRQAGNHKVVIRLAKDLKPEITVVIEQDKA